MSSIISWLASTGTGAMSSLLENFNSVYPEIQPQSELKQPDLLSHRILAYFSRYMVHAKPEG
jgi:hypothetical protein